VERATPF